MRLHRFWMSKEVQNEQLVRQLDRKRHRELFMVAITGLALTVAVVAYAWPHFEIIRLGYRMEELRTEREKLEEVRRHLLLQQATELDPARVEAIARDELGMVYPDEAHRVQIEPAPTPEITRTTERRP